MRGDRERLLDVLEAIDRIGRYAREGHQRFEADELVQVWVLRHLQVIGEATRGLSDELRRQHPEVPWTKIIGMRNVIVHDYFGIELGIVWGVVERDLPPLRAAVEAMLSSVEG